MMTDPIADMLTRIRNGISRGMDSVEIPYSKVNENICKVLVDEGFINEAKVFKHEGSSLKSISVGLKYDDAGIPAITKLDRVSKPSLRVFAQSKNIKPVIGGLGIFVVSTPRGMMSSVEAKKKKLGGEIICMVY